MLASVLSRHLRRRGRISRKDELGLNAPDHVGSSAAAAAAAGSTIKPVKATVFSPEGEADAPDQAGLAIDGNPSTVWPIDTYTDPVPFPNFKNGVGLMLQLPQPATLGDGDHQREQHRHRGGDPLVASADAGVAGRHHRADACHRPEARLRTPSRWTMPSPTSNVLVWVSTLGTVNGESRSDIAEITLKAAS